MRDITHDDSHGAGPQGGRDDPGLLAKILETSPAGITAVNAEGQIFFASRKAEEILGLAKSEITSRVYNVPEWRIITFDGGHFPDEELPFQKVRDTGKAVEDVRHAIVWPDGRTVCLSINASPLIDTHGGFAGIVAALEDITAAVESERVLGRQNRAIRVLTQCNEALIRAADETSLLKEVCHIMVEDGGYRLAWVGYAEEDGGKTIKPVAQCGFEEGYLDTITVTWDETDTGRGPTGTAIRTGQLACTRNILSDPAYARWREQALKRGYASSIALPLIANSHTLGALNIYAAEPDAFDPEEERLLLQMAEDLACGITTLRNREERMRALTELKASREDWRRIFNSISDPVMILDLDQNIVAANPATEKKLDLTRDRILGRKCHEVFHLLDESAEGFPFKSLIESGGAVETEEMEMEAGSGTYMVTVAPIFDDEGKLSRMLLIAKDITDGKKMKEELQDSEARFRSLFDNSPLMLFVLDPDGTVVTVNLAGISQLGYAAEELIGQSVLKVFNPEDRKTVLAQVEQLMKSASVTGTWTIKKVCKDGTEIWVNEVARLMEWPHGRPVILILCENITDRKLAEMALAESETKLRAIFENSRDAIGVSIAGEHVLVNSAYVKLFGYEDEGELIGRPILKLIAPDERDQVMVKVGQRADRESADNFFETCGLTKDGTEFDMEVSVSTYKLDNQTYTLVMLRDISEHKTLEESLRQAQKMESIGRLAGGVAHDFNNYLTAVEGYIDLTLLDLPDGGDQRSNLLEARHSAERAANLTRQLLLFSRYEPLKPAVLNLNAIISNLLKMLSRLIGEQYTIASHFDDDLPPVKADAGQIEQVLMNLVVNARDAMADGGEIEIGTKKVLVDEVYARSHAVARAGEFVRFYVRDAGIGMDGDTCLHVFEPFFSTKQPGHGTGLGLSVAYGIIAQHDGWIEVESQPGCGATFSVFLPASDKAQLAETETQPAGELRGQGQKILLVEDEESVRTLAEKMLAGNDYHVISAASAEEALELFEAAGGAYDLVFSDVILPGMNGVRLVERLLEIKPGLLVMLASGFAEGVDFQAIRDQGYRFLDKPYALTDLLRQVKELLEED
ncbi:MAG: hybrid sensor histidine kinase/response regulator [Thermoleophilia bacterium]